MKINFYISSLSGGGAEHVLTTLANECSKQGHDVKIISLEKRKQFYNPDKSIEIIRSNPKYHGLASAFIDFRLILKTLLSDKETLAVSFLSRCNLLVLLASIFTHNKIVVCDRNNPIKEHGKVTFWLSQIIYLLLADRIVVQTHKIKQMYFEILKEKIVVIENPIDFQELEKQLQGKNYDRDCNTIISLGRLEAQKDFKTLISAFKNIASDYPEWKLKIYGIGNQQEMLKKYISELGISDRAILCGQTPLPFLELKRSSIFVLSSFYEGFPNVLCEALYAGCLCIASDCISGPSELISEGENGYLFEVGNADELSAKLKYCIENQNKLYDIRNNANLSVDRLKKEIIINTWINEFYKVANFNK